MVSPTTTTGTVGAMRPNDEPIALAASVVQYLTDLSATRYLRLEAAVRERATSIPTAPVTVPTAVSLDWDCVARAETGADVNAHGPSYSSEYGVMNEAVRENAPPDVARRILDGSASQGEQLAMAESIAARRGINSWARGTVERCAR